ncbi:MAG: DUF1911 domain-containing protein, partial [Burkholderiales bacterium]|nr:DUF1911 domain-containing protein [Burkholderiales bacterium]
MQFHELRRQQFLNESAFLATKNFFLNIVSLNVEERISGHKSGYDRQNSAWNFADYFFTNYMLKFTSGETLDNLRTELSDVVRAYEEYAKYKREYSQNKASPIFAFQEIDDFECILQLVSLAILLHRRDLIVRIHSLIAGSAYDGEDAMYEELIGHELPDRPYLDEWYHQLPYIHLLNASDAQTSEEQVAQMQLYLNAWYPAMEKATWHDSHLNMTNESCGAYFGYWAIEAAAIVYLYNIDDSSFRDHIVYPKDLVDFARQWDRDHTNASA